MSDRNYTLEVQYELNNNQGCFFQHLQNEWIATLVCGAIIPMGCYNLMTCVVFDAIIVAECKHNPLKQPVC